MPFRVRERYYLGFKYVTPNYALLRRGPSIYSPQRALRQSLTWTMRVKSSFPELAMLEGAWIYSPTWTVIKFHLYNNISIFMYPSLKPTLVKRAHLIFQILLSLPYFLSSKSSILSIWRVQSRFSGINSISLPQWFSSRKELSTNEPYTFCLRFP